MAFKTIIAVHYDAFLDRLDSDLRLALEASAPRNRIGADIGVGTWETGNWGEDLARTFIIRHNQEFLLKIAECVFRGTTVPYPQEIELLEGKIQNAYCTCAKISWEEELSSHEQEQFSQMFALNSGFWPYVLPLDRRKQTVIVKERVKVGLFQSRDEWIEFPNQQAWGDYLRGKIPRPAPRPPP